MDGRPSEHIYSPVRQTQTEKYRYIQRDVIPVLDITRHMAIELAQQITNRFMMFASVSSS